MILTIILITTQAVITMRGPVFRRTGQFVGRVVSTLGSNRACHLHNIIKLKAGQLKRANQHYASCYSNEFPQFRVHPSALSVDTDATAR
jgi:hypothetical protein